MRLELHYRSDVDLSQPAMQVEIRNHIARCLRDHPGGDEGVITLAGVTARGWSTVTEKRTVSLPAPPFVVAAGTATFWVQAVCGAEPTTQEGPQPSLASPA